jgi:hypothetical protein
MIRTFSIVVLLILMMSGILLAQSPQMSDSYVDESLVLRTSTLIKAWAFHDKDTYAGIAVDNKGKSSLWIKERPFPFVNLTPNCIRPLILRENQNTKRAYIIGGSFGLGKKKRGKISIWSVLDAKEESRYTFKEWEVVKEILYLHRMPNLKEARYLCIYRSTGKYLKIGQFRLPHNKDTATINMELMQSLSGIKRCQGIYPRADGWWVVGFATIGYRVFQLDRNGRIIDRKKTENLQSKEKSPDLTLRDCTVDARNGDLILTGQTRRVRYGAAWVGRLRSDRDSMILESRPIFRQNGYNTPLNIRYVDSGRFTLLLRNTTYNGKHSRMYLYFAGDDLDFGAYDFELEKITIPMIGHPLFEVLTQDTSLFIGTTTTTKKSQLWRVDHLPSAEWKLEVEPILGENVQSYGLSQPIIEKNAKYSCENVTTENVIQGNKQLELELPNKRLEQYSVKAFTKLGQQMPKSNITIDGEKIKLSSECTKVELWNTKGCLHQYNLKIIGELQNPTNNISGRNESTPVRFPQPIRYNADSTKLECWDTLQIKHPNYKDSIYVYELPNEFKFHQDFYVIWTKFGKRDTLKYKKDCRDFPHYKSRLFLLCIGIKYEKKYPETYSSVDANRLKIVFEKYNEVLKDGNKLLGKDPVVVNLINDEHTASIPSLNEKLNSIFKDWKNNQKLSTDDYVIIFLSGHGFLFGDQVAFLTEESDTSRSETCYSAHSFFTKIFTDLKPKRISFFIETCNAGDFEAALTNFFKQEKLKEASDLSLLASSSAKQNSYGDKNNKSGFFSAALLKTLLQDDSSAPNSPQNFKPLGINEIGENIAKKKASFFSPIIHVVKNNYFKVIELSNNNEYEKFKNQAKEALVKLQN